MKYKILILLIIFGFIFVQPFFVFADDNDIFSKTCETLEPNILIIIDSSGSMSTHVDLNGDGDNTDPGDLSRIQIARDAVNVVIQNNAGANRIGLMRFHNSEGGYILSHDSSVTASALFTGCESKDEFILDTNGDLKTGVAYTAAIADYKTHLTETVNTITAGGWTPLAETLFEAGRYFGGKASEFNSGIYTSPQGYRCRKNYIVLLTDGDPTMDFSLQTKTINTHLPNVTNKYPGFYGASDPELQEIARLLFEEDLNSHFPVSPETSYEKQNVTTYTIGFGNGLSANGLAILQDTADLGQGESPGNGKYYNALNASDLSDVFESILNEIAEKKTTFAAPIVPIGDASKAYSGNYVYISMFSPKEDKWVGNLKKYSLNYDIDFASCDTQDAILDANGEIRTSANSCWSIQDGDYVDKGGAGEVLKPLTRTLLYNDGTTTLKLFNGSNLTDADFSFVPADMTLNELISDINGPANGWKLLDLNHSRPAFASYVSSGYIFVGSNGGMMHVFDDTNGQEKWAFIPRDQFNNLNKVNDDSSHSFFMDGSPTIADTNQNGIPDTVIIGERRGGNNYYALGISTPLAPTYKFTYTSSTSGQSWKKPEFIDFQKTSIAGDIVKAVLVTGGYDERYDTLDTGLTSPTAKGASIDIIDAATGAVIKQFTGDPANPYGGYVSGMDYSIVSARSLDLVENSDAAITQIYAADLEGHIFALRDNDPNNYDAIDSNWQANNLFEVTGASVGKKILSDLDFVREFMHYYDATSGIEKWIEVVGDWTYFGTGDRADPLDKHNATKTNYFYCVKNDWHTQNINTTKTVDDFTTLDELPLNILPGDINTDKVMLNLTNNDIQDGATEIIKQGVFDALNNKYNRGWYIELEGLGEKCLSTPLVYAGIVYFTTYTPPPPVPTGGVTDPCSSSMVGGTAKLYALDYKTGAAIYKDFDGTPGTLDKDDRSITLNQKNITIPPSPIIIITSRGSKLFVGPKTFNVKDPNNGVTSFYWIDQADVN
jgi:type IV pilus assembly protein PilY1